MNGKYLAVHSSFVLPKKQIASLFRQKCNAFFLPLSPWKAAGVTSVRGVFRCISSEAQEDLLAPPPPSSSVQIPLGSRKEEERENFFYPELGPSGVRKRYSKTSCRNAVWYMTLARRGEGCKNTLKRREEKEWFLEVRICT